MHLTITLRRRRWRWGILNRVARVCSSSSAVSSLWKDNSSVQGFSCMISSWIGSICFGPYVLVERNSTSGFRSAVWKLWMVTTACRIGWSILSTVALFSSSYGAASARSCYPVSIVGKDSLLITRIKIVSMTSHIPEVDFLWDPVSSLRMISWREKDGCTGTSMPL